MTDQEHYEKVCGDAAKQAVDVLADLSMPDSDRHHTERIISRLIEAAYWNGFRDGVQEERNKERRRHHPVF